MAGKINSEVKAMDDALSAVAGLEVDEQRRVVLWLIDKLKLSDSVSLNAGTLQVPPAPRLNAGVGGSEHKPTGTPTAKLFMAQKKPKTDAQRVTCLAYYLTHFKDTSQFKTKELTDLNRKEAAGTPFSNPTVAIDNAKRDQLLSPAGSGKKQITVRGEALVEALPDGEKVAAALAEHPVRRRKPHAGGRRKTKMKHGERK